MNKWLTKILSYKELENIYKSGKRELSDEELLRLARGKSGEPPKKWPPLAKGVIAAVAIGGVGVIGYQCEAGKESKRGEIDPVAAPDTSDAADEEITESGIESIYNKNAEILSAALEKTDLKDIKTLGSKIQTTLYNIMRGEGGSKLKITLGDEIFIQDPSQPQNGIVSESVYFLRIAAAMPDDKNNETQEFFDGLLRGFDHMTALGGGKGVFFPAWTVKIENGRLVLNTDRDADAYNSAADADHDLIMALLIAVQNVQAGQWQDHGYAERLEKLIDGLAAEYDSVGRWAALKPSEDWHEGWFYLDYLSPETCFALAQYLKAKDPNDSRAEFWQKCGEDSLEIYAACLEQIGWVPERALLDADENGDLRVKAVSGRGLQGWDGIRAPKRIAAGLPYYADKLTEKQKAVFMEYLNNWNDPAGKAYGMSPALTAAAYLPLAVQLGAVDVAADLLSVLVREDTAAVYANQDQYYETSLILKALVDVRSPYVLGKLYPIGNYTPAWRLEDVCDPQHGYYGQVGVMGSFGALGFVVNPDPPSQFERYGVNAYLITAESMVSGLADALASNDIARFQAIFNMIEALCIKNYNEGKARRLFLPRVVVLKPRDEAYKLSFSWEENKGDFSIPGGNDGKSSSSGADLMLLALLIKALDLDFHTGAVRLPDFLYDTQSRIKNFIARYAGEMVKNSGDIYPYTDENGVMRLLLTPGGLIGGHESPRDQSFIYEYHTDYVQNLDVLRTIVQYFKPGRFLRLNNKFGSSELYTIFSALLSDTERLKATIDAKFSDAIKYPQGTLQTMYIYLPSVAGQPIRVLDANEFNVEMHPGEEVTEIPLNYPGSNGYDYAYYYAQIMQAAGSGLQPRIDFKRTKAQANVNEDWIPGKTGVGVLSNHLTRHYGIAEISPLHDRRLQNNSEAGRGRLQPENSNNYDKRPYPFTIPLIFSGWKEVYIDWLRAAISRMSEGDYAPQGEQMYTNTLLAYAKLPAATMAKKGMTTELVKLNAIPLDLFLESVFSLSEETIRKDFYIERSTVDVVSDYLLLTNAMFGYDSSELLHRVNMLLAEIERQAQIEKREVDPDNPIVKTLKLQQLLFWNSMSPLQREQLDLAGLEYYGLLPLYNYFKNQPVTQNDEIKLDKFFWNDISLNVHDRTFTADTLKNLKIPRQLKDVLFSEIARRDILDITKKYLLPVQPEKEQEREENLKRELLDYINGLPKVYQVSGLIPILFSDGELDENGDRGADPIPRAVKEKFIDEYLAKIDYTKAGASGQYSTLWQAYTLLLYKEVSEEIRDWVKKVKADKNNLPDGAARQSIRQKLADLTAMLNIMHPTNLPLDQQSGDQRIKEFAAARSANEEAFDDFVDSYAEQNILADIFNNLYWLGNDLEQIGATGEAEAIRGEGSMYRKRAMELLRTYVSKNPGFVNNAGLNSVNMRLNLQEEIRSGGERLTLERIKEDLNNLRQRQETARAYGNRREYANFLLTEVFIYSLMNYNPQPSEGNENPENGYSRYGDIRNDDVLEQFDYILFGVENMERDVYFRNPPPDTDNQSDSPGDSSEELKRRIEMLRRGLGLE
jgi:hypothetical protein